MAREPSVGTLWTYADRQPDGHDLHRFSPTTGAPAPPTLEDVDVVSPFGLVGPLLDLLLAHHPNIVRRKST